MRRHPRPYDPLAPLRPRQVRRQVRQDVLANTRPIARMIGARATSGAQNISGIANELAQHLGALAPQERAIYGAAKSDLGGLDTAIADRLAAAGQTGEADLRKQASLTGVPSALVESLAGGAGAAGAGAAASGFTRGSAEVAALNSRGAGAEDYAARMPGLARLSGLQGVRDVQAHSQRDLADLASRTPSLITSALNSARNREVNKATAGLTYQGNVYGTNTRASTSRYGANTRAGSTQDQIHAANARAAATLAERQRHDQRQEQIARRNARTARIRARTARWKAHNPAGGGSGTSIVPPRRGKP